MDPNAEVKTVPSEDVVEDLDFNSAIELQKADETAEKSNHSKLSDLSVSKRILLAVLILFVTSIFLCHRLFVSFYPHEAEIRNITTFVVGWIFSSASIAAILPLIMIGPVISHYGAFNVCFGSALIAGVSTLLFGLLQYTDSKDIFVVFSFIFRGAQGLALAAFDPAVFVFVDQEFKPVYTTVIGITEGSVGCAMLAGPTVGAVLYERSSFVVPFVVVGAVILPVASFSFGFYKVLMRRGKLIWRKEKSQQTGFKESCMSTFSLFPRIMRKPRLFVGALGMFDVEMMKSSLDPILEPFAETLGIEHAPEVVGYWWLGSSAAYVILLPLIGHLLSKYHKHVDCLVVLSIAHLISAVCLLLIAPSPILPFIPSSQWVSMSALFLLGVASSFCFVPAAAMLMSETERKGIPGNMKKAASASAVLFFLFGRTGSIISPIISGALEPHIGFAWTTTFFSSMALLLAILTLITKCCTENPGLHHQDEAKVSDESL